LVGGKGRNPKIILLQCHFIDEESDMKSLGTEPERREWWGVARVRMFAAFKGHLL
jgi:hypothetical protein